MYIHTVRSRSTGSTSFFSFWNHFEDTVLASHNFLTHQNLQDNLDVVEVSSILQVECATKISSNVFPQTEVTVLLNNIIVKISN